MNYFKYTIGFIVNKLLAGECYYRLSKYKRKISGKNYSLGGNVFCNYPENISIGETEVPVLGSAVISYD